MLNVFAGDAFSTVSLTRAIQATPFVPNLLGMLGIFDPTPITTDTAALERLGNTLALVQTSARGAPPASRTHDKRTLRSVPTVRLALRDRIYAHEVANLRAFGQETALETMQGYAMRRLAKLRQDIELTHENLRMGAIKGIVLDADGSTELVNYYTMFGVSAPTAISFELDVTGTDVDSICRTVVRTMEANAEGGMLPTSTIFGLASNTFFDALVAHGSVAEWYKNRVAADQFLENTRVRRLDFGGITFINYRGTDDGTTLAIPADDCRFVLAGGRDVFQMVYSPMNESADFMNTLGQEIYAMRVPDRDRGHWVDVEVYSYPLPVCMRPRTLLRGTLT